MLPVISMWISFRVCKAGSPRSCLSPAEAGSLLVPLLGQRDVDRRQKGKNVGLQESDEDLQSDERNRNAVDQNAKRLQRPRCVEEQRIRGADGGIDWVLLITGFSAQSITRLADSEFSREQFMQRGAVGITGLIRPRLIVFIQV